MHHSSRLKGMGSYTVCALRAPYAFLQQSATGEPSQIYLYSTKLYAHYVFYAITLRLCVFITT